jgi:hypothetical protein
MPIFDLLILLIANIMEKRNVPLLAFFPLLKGKKPFGMLGLIFLIVSVVMIIPLTIILNTATAPYEKYDHDAIAEKGVERDAIINTIEPVLNVTDNGRHPVIISYEYPGSEGKALDKFQTIDLAKVETLKTGDTIKVKEYNGQSAIVGFQPYSFPFEFFYMLPVTFFSIGLIFFLIGFVPAYKVFKLYQSGIVKDAKVYSMLIENVRRGRSHTKAVVINYNYTDSRSNKLFGTSTTTDLSVMQEMRQDDDIKIFVSETDETQSAIVPKKLAAKQGWRI